MGGDVRATPAVDICSLLMQEGAIISCYDPKVSRESALREFKENKCDHDFERQFLSVSSPDEAIYGSHAIIVLTEWEEFKQYDYERYYQLMQKPAFVFDGRNILHCEMLRDIGFEVHAIGKGNAADSGAY